MNYQQAKYIAIIKRIVGWFIFIPALLSTLISVINFIYQHSEKSASINAVVLDFIHVMVDMIRFNTVFLNIFWFNSPIPDPQEILSITNILFLIIYMLIFVGLALQASGARMLRQVRFIREGIEDQLILEKARGSEGCSREELEKKIRFPHHSIFSQFFNLYILPLLTGIMFYFFIKWFGLIQN